MPGSLFSQAQKGAWEGPKPEFDRISSWVRSWHAFQPRIESKGDFGPGACLDVLKVHVTAFFQGLARFGLAGAI